MRNEIIFEIVDNEFENKQVHKVVRIKPNGDYVMDIKPRIYIELESLWDSDDLSVRKGEAHSDWVSCYVKTAKSYYTGYVRRIIEKETVI